MRGCAAATPTCRVWHWQWSATHTMQRDLRELLPLLEGRVLDVGGASRHLSAWRAETHDVVTVLSAPHAALVRRAAPPSTLRPSGATLTVHPNQPWPLADASFDALLCVQSLAQLDDPDYAVAEMARVMRPGGLAVVSVPAMASGTGVDLRYYTAAGLRQLLGAHFTITSIRREGAIGSVLALLILGWMDALAERSLLVRALQALFLPLWIGTCAAVNLTGAVVDATDPRRAFYTHVLIVAVRKTVAPEMQAASELRGSE